MTDEIIFEEAPPRARPSEHYALLLAVKKATATARVKIGLEQRDAQGLATQVRGAASKIGGGFDVVARYHPETESYGVWVSYSAAPGDEPPVPSPEARAEAKEIIDAAMRRPVPTADDEDIDPIGDDGDDSDWELPERSGAKV